jgi:AcrR family transcriptional regulator
VQERHPTATRLIAEGLRLFAEQGVGATPIVKIEEAAELAPGSGAFYKHFRSKNELLEAAVADAAATTTAAADLISALENYSIEDQARLIARGTWLTFDAHRDLFLVMVRETTVRPASYTHAAGGWPGDGPAFVSSWLEGHTTNGTLRIADVRATALVLLDALTFYWLQRATESPEPYGVNDTHFLDAWVHLVTSLRPNT